MVHRFIGVLIIFVGILVLLGGIRSSVQFVIIEQIPIIGDIIMLISADANDIQTIMLHILLGLVLIFFGVLIVRRKKK